MSTDPSEIPELPDLSVLPELPELPEWPRLEGAKKCAPCGTLEEELRERCERVATPDRVEACVTDLAEAVRETRATGSLDGLKGKLYDVFVKYRSSPSVVPEGAVEAEPEPEADEGKGMSEASVRTEEFASPGQ